MTLQQATSGRASPLLDELDRTEEENIRRYGTAVVEYVTGRRAEKLQSPAIVSHVNLKPKPLAEDLDIPKQVAGRILTAMETTFPSVNKVGQTYQFDVDAVSEVKTTLHGVDTLYTRTAESRAVAEIIELYGPIHGSEVQNILREHLGYRLNTHEVQARIERLAKIETLPGNGGGYVQIGKYGGDW